MSLLKKKFFQKKTRNVSQKNEGGGRAPLSWRMRIFVPFSVTLVLLVTAELFLQIFMPLKFSDRLYWVQDGHIKARLDFPQKVINADGNEVHINALGFRGKDVSWEPAPGTLRLLVLGGSAAFCFQVSDDAHTWPAQLEKALAEKLDRPVEVINLGLPGFDTSNSKVNYLFTGRALHPHVVLVYHTWNDLKFFKGIDGAKNKEMPRDVLSGRRSTGSNPSWITRIFRRFQISRRLDLLSMRIKKTDRENRYTSMEKEGERAHAPVGSRSWRWFEKNFEDIMDFIQSDGALGVLVSQSTIVKKSVLSDMRIRQEIRNEFIGMTLPRLARTYEQATEIIERTARKKNIPYIDGFNAVPSDLVHFHDHVHFLDPGAEALGRFTAEELLKNEQFLAHIKTIAPPRTSTKTR